MRFKILTVAIVLAAAVAPIHASAQEDDIPPAVYPTLVKRASTPEGFVPAGWILETKIEGDLNGDGIPDLVLVLHEQNPKNIVSAGAVGDRTFDTNPRILAVVFGGKGGGYGLTLENHALIPRRESSTVDDPLSENGEVAIVKGVLRVKLQFFASAGSWTMSTTAYSFRFQNGRFELIGFDRNAVTRNSGEIRDVSINYATGKMSITGTIENDKTKVRWKTLPRRPLLTIEHIGDGLEFDPETPKPAAGR